jgi:SAM-dependent methyltransferase
MNWKIKAKAQNIIAFLPSSLSYLVYYLVQRTVGRLKKFDVLPIINGGISTFKLIIKMGHNPVDKVFFEVGTGRTPIAPLVFWLMGAQKTITIDLNPYIKEDLVKETIDFIFDNKTEIRQQFGNLLNEKRLKELSDYYHNNVFSLDDFLALCCIEYIAPGDATNTNLKSSSIDYHTSFTVYEHIPSEIVAAIIKEGNRLLKEDGLFVNAIDYFDHFMHFDNTISSINFLQYSDKEWDKYAGNRYMYMNRLRHDDFLKILKESNHEILIENFDLDKNALSLLNGGLLTVNDRFTNKSNEINCISSSWLVTKPR